MIDSTVNGSTGLGEPFMVAGLDWLWPTIAGNKEEIHGVKIDVQGMEISVLEGMADLARQFAPRIIVEVHEGVPRAKLLHVLAQLGYEAPGIPLEPHPDEMTPAYVNDRSYLFLPQ